MFPGKSTKSAICVLALAALAALPLKADDASPSLWETLAEAISQLLHGEDPEAGLSHEPGG